MSARDRWSELLGALKFADDSLNAFILYMLYQGMHMARQAVNDVTSLNRPFFASTNGELSMRIRTAIYVQGRILYGRVRFPF